jgi:Cu-Zn family superoxide dismutase
MTSVSRLSAVLPLGAALFAAAALQGCAGAGPVRMAREPGSAKAELSGLGGSPISGTLRFSQLGESAVRIAGVFQGLQPGRTYALHIHAELDCVPRQEPGEDFDPFDSRQHGPPETDPGARHAGDLPSVTADGSGRGSLAVNAAKGLTLRHALYSIMGRAVVLHEGPDDFVTASHGGSGNRTACGIVTADTDSPPQKP